MQKFVLVLMLLVWALGVSAQMDANEKYAEKVKTLDATIETLYGVISGEAGEKRDWALMKYLFTPDAKLIPVRKNEAGVMEANYMSCDGYIESSGDWLEKNGFFEKEVHRVTEQFGNITHIFSTYESFRTAADTEPFMRGINSIQLLDDGNRWWIINIYWMGENENNKLPDKYLKQ